MNERRSAVRFEFHSPQPPAASPGTHAAAAPGAHAASPNRSADLTLHSGDAYDITKNAPDAQPRPVTPPPSVAAPTLGVSDVPVADLALPGQVNNGTGGPHKGWGAAVVWSSKSPHEVYVQAGPQRSPKGRFAQDIVGSVAQRVGERVVQHLVPGG